MLHKPNPGTPPGRQPGKPPMTKIETTFATTIFGGIGYRSRRDMIAGAVGNWLYGQTNTDDDVRAYLTDTTPQTFATLLAIDGWLAEIHKSDQSVCHVDLVQAIEEITAGLDAR